MVPVNKCSVQDVKRVSSIEAILHNTECSGRNEMDSHADTIVVGNNCIVLELSRRNVSVSLCSEEYALIDDIPIATVATAYDCPDFCQVFILIFNEALYFGKGMAHTLLCPNQLRAYRVSDGG